MFAQNVAKVNAYNFFGFFMVIMPVLVPFFKDCGLSMEQVFQLQAIFSVGLLVFEIPSGYLSDLWGRKKTLLVSWVVETIGAIGLLYAHDFQSLLFFELTLSVSCSLRSGTDVSLIYDSLYAAGKSGSQSKAMSKYFCIMTSSEGLASILASVLILWGMEAVIWVYVLTRMLAGLPLFSVVEPPRRKMAKAEHKGNFRRILAFVYKSDEVIFLLFLNMVFWGMATFIVVWAYQHIWQELNIPLVYFGYIWAAYSLAKAFLARIYPSLERKWGQYSLVMFMGAASVMGYLGFALLKLWPVVFLGFLFCFTRVVNQITLKDAFNARLPSEFRATANSLVGFVFRLIFVFVGPLAGYIIDQSGSQTMMAVFGALFLLVYFAILWPLLKKIRAARIREEVEALV